MADDTEIRAKFWAALKSDMTMMIGLEGVEDGHTQPMTAQLEDNGADDRSGGPIWFFCSKESALAQHLGDHADHRAIATFVSKDHDLFASVHGTLSADNDRAVVDRLWNAFVAAWFEGGKDDPKLQLLRLDPERAQIWLDGSSLVAGVKMLLGADPKQDYKEKVADVSLG